MIFSIYYCEEGYKYKRDLKQKEAKHLKVYKHKKAINTKSSIGVIPAAFNVIVNSEAQRILFSVVLVRHS